MIKIKILKDLKKCLDNLELQYNDRFVIEVPAKPEYGDFSTNVALVCSKMNNMKPMEMAEIIIKKFSKNKDFEKVDIVAPGFINIKLSKSIYYQTLVDIYHNPDEYGMSEHGQGKKILLEFVSANPTGPLNIVSARAAAFGDTLFRIMNHVGYDATREFYINDAGNQVDILAESLELRFRELLGERIGDFPMEAYHGEYLKDLAIKLNSAEGTKLLHLSITDRMERIKEFALEEIHNMQQESLLKFEVEFDSWVSEKTLRQQGIIEEVLSYLYEADCTYEKEDAIWFCSTKYGDEKDRVLMKADGSITYFVPDLAYHLTKYQRGYDQLIDVLGPDHHGYVPRMMAAIKALKYDESKLEIIFLQQVNLYEQGEKVKMSKRAGKIVTMDELIDEVGKDAARYFFIDRKPSAHLNFDLDLAKKQSSENPVYYCQYAYARICSIQKLARKEKIIIRDFEESKLKKLNREDEVMIIKKMMEFPSILIAAADSREPHRLAFYAQELSSMFHKYYQNAKIINKKSPELSQCRLYLVTAIKNVLQIAFTLMSINAPEKM